MAASPNNTIIKSPNTILTDANGNEWYINSAGKIVVNGVVDQTTGNVQVLAYENGQVWQMNASDLWWAKTLPTDAWGPTYGTATSPLENVASINDTVITWAGSPITDADDNQWSITASGQVAVNGVADQTTGRVDELAYYNGVIWQKNADNHWYSKTSAAAAWVQWTQPTPPVPIPDTSYNNAQIFAGSAGVLVDANGNDWGIVSGQVTVDGVVDPTTANVTEMAIVNGKIWQENQAGLWYSKTTPASAWSAGTPTTPIFGGGGPTLTWTGGANNLASNPADWSPSAAPAPGNALEMTSGTMNIVGNALVGDILTIAPSATSGNLLTDTINTSGAAALNLFSLGGGFQFYLTLGLNVATGSTLTLNAELYTANLTAAGGGTIALTGSNFFAGSTVFDDNLTGSGTVTLPSANHVPQDMVINGSVSSGLTFMATSLNGSSDLTIAHPGEFQGLIQLSGAPEGLGHIEFAGIQATTADLLQSVLYMFNGGTLVDATRFSDPAGLSVQLHQTSVGVILTAGSFNDTGNAGTVIPLRTS
jgi:ribosomal protein S11